MNVGERERRVAHGDAPDLPAGWRPLVLALNSVVQCANLKELPMKCGERPP